MNFASVRFLSSAKHLDRRYFAFFRQGDFRYPPSVLRRPFDVRGPSGRPWHKLQERTMVWPSGDSAYTDPLEVMWRVTSAVEVEGHGVSVLLEL